LSEMFISMLETRGVCLQPLNLRSYWTEVHQVYKQCSQITTDKLSYNQNGDIAMPELRIKVNSPMLPILTLKLVTMETSLEPSEKGGQIRNLRLNTYHRHIW